MSKDEKSEYQKDPKNTGWRETYRDNLKFIEMQMNKKNYILDKAKLVCIKLDKVFIAIPYTVSKIELRMRNILINNR